MKKSIAKSLSIILSVCMLAGSINLTAFADELDNNVVVNEENENYANLIEDDYYDVISEEFDSDELLEGYFYYGADKEISLFSSNYNGDKLTGLTKMMYEAIKTQSVRIAAGEESSTEVTISLVGTGFENSIWTAEDLEVDYLTTTVDGRVTLTEEARNAISRKIDYDYRLAWQSALRDCPYEMYWAGLTISTSGYKRSEDGTLAGIGETLTIGLVPSDDFIGSNRFSVDTNKTSGVEAARLNAMKIVEDNAGLSDMDKMKTYVMSICQANTYNHDAAAGLEGEYGNPWQLIYVFDGNPDTNVVCEGYSKAFQYLMENSTFESDDIYTYVVSGSTSEDHMWNIAHMDDGRNYLLDVTNCDGAYDKGLDAYGFFLLSADSGDVDNGYTFKVENYNPITYTYEDDTRLVYSDEELAISDTPYNESDTAEAKIIQLANKAKNMYEFDWDANIKRALWLHDYIVDKCVIDETGEYNTVDNVLYDGKGTKKAIIDTYVALLSASDIDNDFIEVGEAEWLTVCNEMGDWCHVDIIKDIQSASVGDIDFSRLYFGLDDELMSQVYPDYNENSEQWCGIGQYARNHHAYMLDGTADVIVQKFDEQIQNAVNNRDTQIILEVEDYGNNGDILYNVVSFYLAQLGSRYDNMCVLSSEYRDGELVVDIYYNDVVVNNPSFDHIQILDDTVVKGQKFKVDVVFDEYDDEINFGMNFYPLDPKNRMDINNCINASFTKCSSKTYEVEVPMSIKSGDYILCSVLSSGPSVEGAVADLYNNDGDKLFEDEGGSYLKTQDEGLSGGKKCYITGYKVVHIVAPEGTDETNPVINNIKVPYGTVGDGGTFEVEFDLVEDDTYVKDITINFSAYSKYGFSDNFAITKYFSEEDDIKTGHYVLEGEVPANISCVDYQISSVSVWDAADNNSWYLADYGNDYGVDEEGNRYIPLYDWDEERCYISGNTYLRVTKKVDGGLSNGAMVNTIKQLEEGENAEVDVKSNDTVCSDLFFDTIKDKDIEVAFKKDNTSWHFNGKDIVNESKDIELDADTEVTKGTLDGETFDLYKVEFPSNGELPGKCNVGVTAEFFKDLYGKNINVLYYDEETGEYLLESSANPTVVKEDDVYYCTFDVDHNSTFMISTTNGLDSEVLPEPYTYDVETKTLIVSDVEAAIGPSEYAATAERLVITEGVISIAEGAFADYANLKSVEIPSSVTEIGKNAFSKCEFTIFNVKNDDCDFYEDRKTLGDFPIIYANMDSSAYNFAILSDGSFYNFEGQFVLGLNYDEDADTLYVKNMNNLYKIPNTYRESSIKVVVNDVTNIGGGVFSTCTNLKEAEISGEVDTIGEGAFSHCAKLETVALSDNISTIESGCFRQCTSLTSVNIPKKLVVISGGMFDGCINLSDVTIPSNINKVASGAFSGCGFETFVVPENVEEFDTLALYNCNNLTDVYFYSDCIKNTGSYVPMRPVRLHGQLNTTLADIVLQRRLALYDFDDNFILGYHFDEDDGTYYITGVETTTAGAISGLNNADVKKAILTDVQELSAGTFVNFVNMTSIEIGEGLTTVYTSAFYNCKSLETIVFPKSFNDLKRGAFAGCENLSDIYVYNPECAFADSDDTVLEGTVIHGFKGSTAEEYANSYERTFVPFEQYIYDEETKTLTIQNVDVCKEIPAEYKYSDIERLVIKGSVKRIDESAFKNEYKIHYIVIEDGVESIGNGAFDGVPWKELTVYSKDCVIDAYTGKPGPMTTFNTSYDWNSFANIYANSTLDWYFKKNSAFRNIKYLDEKCTLTFDWNNGNGSKQTIVGLKGQKLDFMKSIDYPTKKGYYFTGWYTQPEGGELVLSSSSNCNVMCDGQDTTYYAHWELGKIAITFGDPRFGGEVHKFIYGKPYNDESNTDAWPAKTDNDKNVFMGWNTDSNGNGTYVTESDICEDELTLYEIWGARITFDPNGGQVSKKYADIIRYSYIGTLPTPTRTGYTFDGWYTDKEGGSKISGTYMVYENRTLYAHWASLEGWKIDKVGKWYQNADGTYPKSAWKLIDGKWYHFNASGYMETNKWIGNYYLKVDGTMAANEWVKIDNKWYYFESNGSKAVSKWVGNYYLKANGVMATNEWVDGGKYYVDANGVWVPGKVKIIAGWKHDNTGWWYQNADGSYPKNAWKYIGTTWYFFNTSGYMVTGWQKIGNTWYYFETSGAMAHDKWVGDYYLTSSGAMATNCWIGNYYVGSSGAWVKGKTR